MLGVRKGRPEMWVKTGVGVCELCGHQTPKDQMTKHLTSCIPQHDSGRRPARLVQFQVEAAGAPEYWLYVEGREDASLQQLDSLFRQVWLECCGHMSAFRIGRIEAAKRSALGVVCSTKGARFEYDYDFGSTTTLKAKVIGFREGAIGRTAVRIVARNTPLASTCEACDKPAVLVCPSCMYSGPSLFCKTHAATHPCDADDVWLPVVNSPRMGVCGYTG